MCEPQLVYYVTYIYMEKFVQTLLTGQLLH